MCISDYLAYVLVQLCWYSTFQCDLHTNWFWCFPFLWRYCKLCMIYTDTVWLFELSDICNYQQKYLKNLRAILLVIAQVLTDSDFRKPTFCQTNELMCKMHFSSSCKMHLKFSISYIFYCKDYKTVKSLKQNCYQF